MHVYSSDDAAGSKMGTNSIPYADDEVCVCVCIYDVDGDTHHGN